LNIGSWHADKNKFQFRELKLAVEVPPRMNLAINPPRRHPNLLPTRFRLVARPSPAQKSPMRHTLKSRLWRIWPPSPSPPKADIRRGKQRVR